MPADIPPYIDTLPNPFGIFRRYTSLPSRNPEEGLSLDDFTDAHTHTRRRADQHQGDPLRLFGTCVLAAVQNKATNAFAPFLNITVFRLMHWLYTGSALKSAAELTRLVREVFLAPDYHPDHIHNFNAERENDRLDVFAGTSQAFSAEDGWREGTVKIHLPKEKHHHASEADAPVLEIKNLFYRPFLEVIRAGYQDTIAHGFHWFPFHLFQRPRNSTESSGSHTPVSTPSNQLPPERLYSDIYNSDAMVKEDTSIQEKARTAREEGDDEHIEYAVAPILVYSDSTHLTNFGTAALWPIYIFFGNLSKYIRARPTSFSAHHLAYIPSVSLNCSFPAWLTP